MARVLVTGGLGFIGCHLSRALLERGDEVVIADDFSNAPYPRQLKERNAVDLGKEFARVSVARACVTEREAMKPLFDGVDAVIHLAGLAGVRPSFADPARYARVNVEGTAIVHELAREHGIKRFLFASSSSVYGNSTPLPAREDSAAIAPESPYAASKRSAELVALALCRRTPEMTCAALRFFTVYGPRQRPEMAITLFTRALLAGKPLTVFGEGGMRRDFTFVDDIVRGILATLAHAPPGFRPYNLGSGAPVALNDLVTAIGRAVGVEPRVERVAVPIGDVDATFADIARAREELGWKPEVNLHEGLRRFVQWARANPA